MVSCKVAVIDPETDFDGGEPKPRKKEAELRFSLLRPYEKINGKTKPLPPVPRKCA